jgi:hypothetical protein
MASLEEALTLAGQGFHVFPVLHDGKLPAIEAWQDKATTDPERIKRWWIDPVLELDQDWNIGICTTRFNCKEALIAIDVDNKNGKDGSSEIIRLEIEGKDLPPTRGTATPTGGSHLFYRAAAAVPNGVDVLARGLDIRSRGGYVVGPGSTIGAGRYVGTDAEVAPAPEWLIKELTRPEPTKSVPLDADISPSRANKRAIEYLKTAPLALEGDGGDHTTFQVAAKLKDLGVSEDDAFALMLEWNDRCEPPWDPLELELKIHNAFRYGKNAPGVDDPATQFPPVADETEEPMGSPTQRLNKEYAFIKRGCFILHEMTNEKGAYEAIHMTPAAMNHYFANQRMMVGKAEKPVSQVWMEWGGRRTYDGIVFSPEKEPVGKWYNLWRGFKVAPAATGDHPSVEMFKEHALLNICDNDLRLFDWLMGYFAHLIQRPYEKPLVALVFRGAKGTGKNALVERVGHLLGGHFMVADDDRYLMGNFNSHMEACLFMVLDEAAWAGDKRAEGRLKGLITGASHNIERKGEEVYKVDNLTRIAIIGNEDWLVPASQDERRFAVFNVGDGRKQDRKFFIAMREGMEQGGYAHLLTYLKNYPITQDVNDAPQTAGLVEQKLASMSPFETWWYECIKAESILGTGLPGWPDTINKERLRDVFYDWMKKRGFRQMRPSEDSLGRLLRKMAPSVYASKQMVNGDRHPIYKMSDIEVLRREFAAHCNGKVGWE